MKKRFTLGAVLSVTTGTLLCDIGDVYVILNHMTGDNLFTHQLPRASEECAPHLRKQFPALADETAADVTKENWREWLTAAEARYGNAFDVEPLPDGAHEVRDPIAEAVDMVGPERVVTVRV